MSGFSQFDRQITSRPIVTPLAVVVPPVLLRPMTIVTGGNVACGSSLVNAENTCRS
jgi:hypothetical protein